MIISTLENSLTDNSDKDKTHAVQCTFSVLNHLLSASVKKTEMVPVT